MKKLLLSLTFITTFSVCVTAQPWANATLNINQVAAMINSNGDLFWDYTNGRYEIPAGSGTGTNYAAATWIGGLDANGSLHLSAQTYRQSGSDFYPGPVMNTASYSAATDAFWNTTWKINKTTIDSFVQWSINPPSMPGYVIPPVIQNWPGNGDVVSGQAVQLAPYVDVNQDGVYSPASGDYPCIKGDQAVFVIYNDDRNTHTETGGAKFTLEVHAMLYAYSAPGTWLDSTVFLNYQLYNRSAFDYDSLYWGHWNDFDLGFYGDDFVGCDVSRSISYVYNGDANDGATTAPQPGTYGANPPAQGLMFLRGPEATPADGLDNDRDGITDESDEAWAMSRFLFYNNDFTATGNPVTAMDYYNYLNGYWKDGSPITYGGNGYGGTTPSGFMFPDNSDPLGWGTNFVPQAPWSEVTSSNTPSDRRAMASSGPFQFDAGKQMCLDMALVYGRGTNGPASGISAMQNAADSARVFYQNNNPCDCDQSTVGIQNQQPGVAAIYPNPATDQINIICGDNSTGSAIEIIDATGKLVHTSTVLSGNSAVLDVSALSAGIYFVRVNKGSVVLTGKFIRN